MSEQMRYRDVGSGEFVTAEYAAEHPTTTVPDYFPQHDRLAETLAAVTALTDSQISWTGVIAGITRTGTSPEEIADQLLLDVRALLDGGGVTP